MLVVCSIIVLFSCDVYMIILYMYICIILREFCSTDRKTHATVSACAILSILFTNNGNIPHVLFLLVKVPLIVLLYYMAWMLMCLPLSQLVALGKNNIHY